MKKQKDTLKAINLRLKTEQLQLLREVAFVTDYSIQELVIGYIAEGVKKERANSGYKDKLTEKGLKLIEDERLAA